MPVTTDKPKQFAFIMTEAEHRMLGELAERDGRTAAAWLRAIIQENYVRRGLGTFADRVERAFDKLKIAHRAYLRRARVGRVDSPNVLEEKLDELRKLADAARNRRVFSPTQRYLAELTTTAVPNAEKLDWHFDRVRETVETWARALRESDARD